MMSCTSFPNSRPPLQVLYAVPLQLPFCATLQLPPSQTCLIDRCHHHQTAQNQSASSHVLPRMWLVSVAGPLAHVWLGLSFPRIAVIEHCLMMSCTFSPKYHPQPQVLYAVPLQLPFRATLPLPPFQTCLIDRCHHHQTAQNQSASSHVLPRMWLVSVAGPLAHVWLGLSFPRIAVIEHCLMMSC